jgi:hypothetical protein
MLTKTKKQRLQELISILEKRDSFVDQESAIFLKEFIENDSKARNLLVRSRNLLSSTTKVLKEEIQNEIKSTLHSDICKELYEE